jgi:signal peptidase II
VKVTKAILVFALMVMTIGCDQVSKHLATDRLSGSPGRSFLADTLRLEYAENTGAFLSLGENLPENARTTLLVGGCGLMLIGLFVFAVRFRVKGGVLVAISLIVAGGISNLIDRISHGNVVDFLNLGVGNFRTGIFNVADIAIVAGVILFAWASRRGLAQIY